MIRLFLLTSFLLAACGDPPPARLNVVLIVMDTARGDRTTLNGYEKETTPFLASLAGESTVYTDAWSPTCWTGPAHASLFTGLRPEHHGFLAGVRLYLDARADTLAEVLGRAGYETAGLICNPTVAPQFALDQGFNSFEMFDEIPGAKATPSRRATAKALEIIRRSRAESRPYFVFVNHWQPHLPYDPPPGFAERFLSGDAAPAEVSSARAYMGNLNDMYAQGQLQFTPRRWETLGGLYDGELAVLDDELHRFVTALREEGALDNTILVVTSDHGENLGDHGLSGHFLSLHQSVRRIPMLIRYPGGKGRGRTVDSVVRLEDLYPTLLALCGLPVPLRLDGLTLVDPEQGRLSRASLGGAIAEQVARDHPEFARSGLWRPQRAVYDGRYHLIRRQDGHEELYDHREDPGEMKNLVTARPDLLLRLRDLLPNSP